MAYHYPLDGLLVQDIKPYLSYSNRVVDVSVSSSLMIGLGPMKAQFVLVGLLFLIFSLNAESSTKPRK